MQNEDIKYPNIPTPQTHAPQFYTPRDEQTPPTVHQRANTMTHRKTKPKGNEDIKRLPNQNLQERYQGSEHTDDGTMRPTGPPDRRSGGGEGRIVYCVLIILHPASREIS